jgi:hypothetical protein
MSRALGSTWVLRLGRLLNIRWLWSIVSGWNLPIFKLFKEMNFIVVVHELWENLSIVSKIVNKILERLSISIKEHFVINLLEFMHTIEELLKSGSWHLSENISLSHHMVSASHVESHNL